MLLPQIGHMMHHHPQTLRRELIPRVGSVTYMEILVICSGIAGTKTGSKRVPHKLKDQLIQELVGQELRLTWFVQREPKLKHPSRRTLVYSCCQILMRMTRFHW